MNKVLLIFLVVYILSVGSDPILGDSLVFTVIASKGFDLGTNATNHFLYINTLAVYHKIFPMINPHYLFIAFSIGYSLATLYVLKKILLLFNIKKEIVNISVLVFGLSFTFWRVSIITEVYSLYTLSASIFIFYLFSFIRNKKIIHFYYASIVFGLMFLIHIQTILLAPLYLYFICDNLRNDKKIISLGVFIPIVIFSILLVPVFQGKQSFISIFTDNAWGKSFFNFDFKIFLKSVIRNSAFLLYNFMFFIYFLVIGIKKTPFKKYFIIAIVPYVIFILKHDVSDSYVFHLIPYLFFMIIIAKGLETYSLKRSYLLVVLMPLIYFSAFKVIDFTKYGELINDEKGFKGGTRYFFFPPLNGNPSILKFIEAYNENKLKDKKSFDGQFKFAEDWISIKKNY